MHNYKGNERERIRDKKQFHNAGNSTIPLNECVLGWIPAKQMRRHVIQLRGDPESIGRGVEKVRKRRNGNFNY